MVLMALTLFCTLFLYLGFLPILVVVFIVKRHIVISF